MFLAQNWEAAIRSLFKSWMDAHLRARCRTRPGTNDPAERKKIEDGGAAVIEQSNDSMILLARKIDAYSRDLRKR